MLAKRGRQVSSSPQGSQTRTRHRTARKVNTKNGYLLVAHAGLLSLLTSGCLARIASVEQFSATSVAGGSAHKLVPTGALSPEAVAFRVFGEPSALAVVQIGASALTLEVDHRYGGAWLAGPILPVIPSLGALADPKDWAVVLSIHHDQNLSIDPTAPVIQVGPDRAALEVVEHERHVSDWGPFPLSPSDGNGPDVTWTQIEVAFDMTYLSADEFELRLPVETRDETTEIIYVRFERVDAVYWDTGFNGGPVRRLSRRRTLAAQ